MFDTGAMGGNFGAPGSFGGAAKPQLPPLPTMEHCWDDSYYGEWSILRMRHDPETRPPLDEFRARARAICRQGLPCVPWLEVAPGGQPLWLRLEPSPGWLDSVREDMVHSWGPYHISLCWRDQVSPRDWRDLVASVLRRLHGRPVRLRVAFFGAGCTAALCRETCPVGSDPAVRALWGRYGSWELHISM